MLQPSTTSLYIHWPFCKHKCPYCDFNSHVSKQVNYEMWLKAYIKELTYFLPYLQNKQLISIFFGGGTPSLLPGEIIHQLLDWLRTHTSFAPEIEITLEANPTSVESTRFKEYKEAGINRLSLGIQSLRPEELKFLGRQHSKEEAIDAINIARSMFDNYSFDLIYARPNQTEIEWEQELTEALALAGPHLSLYQLTIEKGTPFYSAYQKHEFALPNEETSVNLYTMTHDIMSHYGLPFYEISNYAKPGFECLHNIQYWQYNDYLGIGPGAHSRITQEGKKQALMMIHGPDQWLESVGKNHHGIQQQHVLSIQEKWEEILMMGLRLRQGIHRSRLEGLVDKPLEEILPSILLKQELIALNDKHLSIAPKGRLLTNSIVSMIATSIISLRSDT